MTIISLRAVTGLLATTAIMAGCAAFGAPSVSGQRVDLGVDRGAIDGGRDVAESLCSSCHAIGRTGESPDPAAPAFRTLHERYRFDVLAEELAAGVHVGQARMPKFHFDLETTDALMAYLRDIQVSDTQP